ncbi:Uncharacterized protein FKW44_009449 [Caligus rogercresseyi]|uniref:Uncharacterized protein n=1 Tax=Caligus rogercresseyi TaxID=217165 RepID=A0A7T8HFC6_CALRO|nr:Uncharacterized protein FKW44_009449 [Caligus rogercresseyi]
MSDFKEYKARRSVEESSEGTEEGDGNVRGNVEGPELKSVKYRMFKNCSLCAYVISSQCNLFTDAYHTLCLAYKFLLTLSTTQITCDRCSIMILVTMMAFLLVFRVT